MAQNKIGILAGSGMMPVEIVKHCLQQGREVFVVCLSPFAQPDTFAHVPHGSARLGEAGKIIKLLKDNQVEQVVLAGGIKRPAFMELMPDWEAVKILAKLSFTKIGDDGLFRAVIREFESRGFEIVGIEQVVPEMMFHEGVYGKVKPSQDDMDDIRRGLAVATALGKVDVGQATVVQEGMVLAVEAIEGTDAMLSRAMALKKKGKKPVMVKIKKPGQESRVDLPAIGVLTIEQLTQYGIGGIAVEAGGVLLIEREEVVRLADKAGIFIIGMKIEE